jgi:hypothetical protein
MHLFVLREQLYSILINDHIKSGKNNLSHITVPACSAPALSRSADTSNKGRFFVLSHSSFWQEKYLSFTTLSSWPHSSAHWEEYYYMVLSRSSSVSLSPSVQLYPWDMVKLMIPSCSKIPVLSSRRRQLRSSCQPFGVVCMNFSNYPRPSVFQIRHQGGIVINRQPLAMQHCGLARDAISILVVSWGSKETENVHCSSNKLAAVFAAVLKCY